MHLNGYGPDTRFGTSVAHVEGNVGRALRLKRFRAFPYQFRHKRRFGTGIQRFGAVGHADLLHEIFAADSGIKDMQNVLVGRVFPWNFRQGKLGASGDSSEDIVHVMGDPSRHAADGLHTPLELAAAFKGVRLGQHSFFLSEQGFRTLFHAEQIHEQQDDAEKDQHDGHRRQQSGPVLLIKRKGAVDDDRIRRKVAFADAVPCQHGMIINEIRGRFMQQRDGIRWRAAENGQDHVRGMYGVEFVEFALACQHPFAELATPRGIHGQVGPAAELLQAFLHGVALAVGCAVVAEVQEHRIPGQFFKSFLHGLCGQCRKSPDGNARLHCRQFRGRLAQCRTGGRRVAANDGQMAGFRVDEGDGFKDAVDGEIFQNAGIVRPAFGKLCGRIRDAAKDDGDAREKAVPVGEHEVQRVVIRYNDGFEGYPGVFSGKQAYEFVIQTSGRMAFIVEIFAMQAYTEARFRIFKLFRDPLYDVVFPEMAGMKRIDDQNFGGGQRSRPLRHISKGHRLCRENGAEQADTFGEGGKRLHGESPKKSVCPMILRESAL